MNREGEPSTRKTLVQRAKETVDRVGLKLQDYHEEMMKQHESSDYIVFAVPGGGGFVSNVKRPESRIPGTVPPEASSPSQGKDTIIFNKPPDKIP